MYTMTKTETLYARFLILLACLACGYVAAGAQTLASQYRDLWAEAQEAYSQAVGYRATPVTLTPGMLSSNASDIQEGQHLEYLLDGDPATFWHSDWHGVVQETHYLQIDLDHALTGDIALYVRRRLIDSNHVTLMECRASRDGAEWVSLGRVSLGNACSGGEVTSSPISLGGGEYAHLRLCFLRNTGGYAFAHLAELRLLSVEVLGEGMNLYLAQAIASLLAQLERGRGVPDADVTQELLDGLRQAYDTLVMEMGRVRAGLLPSYMVQQTDLPTLYVNTYDGTDITSKTEYKYACMWRIEGDSTAVYDSMEIRGRGNSTWGLEKKPYRLKFAHKEKFLGKGHANARSWTLLANHSDKTLLRNAVASFIGRQLGQPFVPSAEFVDVVLNGEYLGNYQVSDQMQVHKKRVEIVEQEDASAEGADISGGYLIEFAGTLEGEPSYFHTRRGQAVAIKSPDDDVITDAQKDYIRDFVNDFEDRLYADNYQDSLLGYRTVVDSSTLASWFVANEYTANPDGYYSTYAYKERGDGHLRWGPMWDYDIAFNNCYRLRQEMTDKLMLDEGYTSGRMKEYVQRMWGDEWFRNLAGRTWHRAVCEDGMVDRTLAYVDSMARVIDQSQARNFQRWSLGTRVYDELVLFSTYQEGVDYLKAFLRGHAAYLSSVLPNPEELTPPLPAPANPLGVDEDALYYIYNVNTGNVADISSAAGGLVCTWSSTESRAATQLWQVTPVTGDYYRLILQGSSLAIADAAISNGSGYSTGARLILDEVDAADDRQLWRFEPTAGYYAIVNKATGLAWNNMGGKADDGTPVISWTSDEANAAKPTRQWYIVRGGLPDGIAQAAGESDIDYRVGYDRVTQEVLLHVPLGVASEGCAVSVHDDGGRLVGEGSALVPVSLAGQPSGVYVVSWNVHGSRRSVKFMKP